MAHLGVVVVDSCGSFYTMLFMLLHPSTAPDHGKKPAETVVLEKKWLFVCRKIDVVDVCSFCCSERVLSKHHKSDVSLAKFRQTANESYQILIIIAETRLELKSRRVERFIGDGSESFWAFRGFRSMKRWMPKSIIVTTHEEYCTRKLFLLCLDLL